MALLLMAQVTNAVGSYWERRRQSRRRGTAGSAGV